VATPSLLFIASRPADKVYVHLVALPDGCLHVTILSSTRSFLSQPIDTNSNNIQRTVLLTITLSDSELNVYVSGQKLLPYSEGVAKAVLLADNTVPRDLSLNDPSASINCQQWIQNRRSKFSGPPFIRSNRQLKTVEEQASDLRTSILRLRHLVEQVRLGKKFLLGTLAGEMRASINWGKDDKPEHLNNPLLLRMANLAELPLPVFVVPEIAEPPILGTAIMDYDKSRAPRIKRLYGTDQVADLQESLVSTVLRLGPVPGKTIKALDLIAELANTMGASHYDHDASDFLKVLEKMETAEGDLVLVFMCQTADVLISLSEWVLSELKNRNIIL
jgi:hypothetical protein